MMDTDVINVIVTDFIRSTALCFILTVAIYSSCLCTLSISRLLRWLHYKIAYNISLNLRFHEMDNLRAQREEIIFSITCISASSTLDNVMTSAL